MPGLHTQAAQHLCAESAIGSLAPPPPLHPLLRLPLLGLLVTLVVTQSFIDLEVSADLGSWHANLPVVDLCALLLLPLGLVGLTRSPAPLPAPAAFGLFGLASALSIFSAHVPDAAFHHFLRKPLFLYMAYGMGLAWIAARWAPRALLHRALLAWMAATALVSLVTSVGRIGAGNALWYGAISGLTPNHKTLAVSLAGGLPLVLGLATASPGWLTPTTRRRARGVVAGALLAIFLSASKTAWLAAALGVALFFPARRPLACRPRVIAPALTLGVATALLAPLLIGSKTMLDAARSRHSLNKRAAVMFTAYPLLGAGTGMNVHVEQVTFPDYRVNGVDAHGVVQKVASETGLLGLAGMTGFAVLGAVALRRRTTGPGDPAWGSLATWGTLHFSLLLSTETLSPTHWVPLGLAWGLAHRPVPNAHSTASRMRSG